MRGAEEVSQQAADIEIRAGSPDAKVLGPGRCHQPAHPAESVDVVLPLLREDHGADDTGHRRPRPATTGILIEVQIATELLAARAAAGLCEVIADNEQRYHGPALAQAADHLAATPDGRVVGSTAGIAPGELLGPRCPLFDPAQAWRDPVGAWFLIARFGVLLSLLGAVPKLRW